MLAHWQLGGGKFASWLDEHTHQTIPMPVPWSEAWPQEMDKPVPVVLSVVRACHDLVHSVGETLHVGPRAAPGSASEM
jgi:hypothetical protein